MVGQAAVGAGHEERQGDVHGAAGAAIIEGLSIEEVGAHQRGLALYLGQRLGARDAGELAQLDAHMGGLRVELYQLLLGLWLDW